MPTTTRAKAPAKAKPLDLAKRGAQVLSVFGAFSRSTLVLMPTELAEELFPGGLVEAAPSNVVEAAERDIAALRERDEELAGSALAASVIALAFQIEHPYNSATSKSMCARAMREAEDRLRTLGTPAEAEPDDLDKLRARREHRRQSAT
jgi:hypothetical protein